MFPHYLPNVQLMGNQEMYIMRFVVKSRQFEHINGNTVDVRACFVYSKYVAQRRIPFMYKYLLE